MSTILNATNRTNAIGHDEGFSLLEVLVSTAVMLTVTAGIFSVMNPATGAFSREPEVADTQQRLRVATDTLYKDLVMAGGGAYSGTQAGTLSYFFASVLPYRQGLTLDDPPGTYKTDTITLMYVPTTSAQTTISQPMPASSSELKVNSEPQCDKADCLCGFKGGMNVLIYDDTGSYDNFTITEVQCPAAHLQHNLNDLAKQYDTNSKIVQVADHTYYLNAQTSQLMHYDGSNAPDTPVVDNVVGLNFEYYGDPQPPTLIKPLSDPAGPWTTYGPKPPALTQKTTAYPVGENCAFQVVGGFQVPRLAVLGAGGSTLVQLKKADLDGSDPNVAWCPDAANPNRFNANLLRIRKIVVTLRVQTAAAALRGPASALFTNGGTALQANKWIPDQEIRFQVTPRNLNLGR